MSLGTTYSPTVPVGGVTSYKLRPVLTCSNGYRGYTLVTGVYLYQCTGILRMIFWLGREVEKRGIGWGNFPLRNLSWWKKISMKGAQDLLALFKKKKQ